GLRRGLLPCGEECRCEENTRHFPLLSFFAWCQCKPAFRRKEISPRILHFVSMSPMEGPWRGSRRSGRARRFAIQAEGTSEPSPTLFLVAAFSSEPARSHFSACLRNDDRIQRP